MSQCSTFYNDVTEFYDLTGQSRPAIPTPIPSTRRNMLMAYIMAEVIEFGYARTLHDQVDAAVDLLYFVMDTFVELGVDPAVPWGFVHDANMNKIFPDGLAHFDHSVVPPRLLRPDGWVDPKKDIYDYLEDRRRMYETQRNS